MGRNFYRERESIDRCARIYKKGRSACPPSWTWETYLTVHTHLGLRKIPYTPKNKEYDAPQTCKIKWRNRRNAVFYTRFVPNVILRAPLSAMFVLPAVHKKATCDFHGSILVCVIYSFRKRYSPSTSSISRYFAYEVTEQSLRHRKDCSFCVLRPWTALDFVRRLP